MQKLLIVDDDEISLELLDNLLSRQGYEVLSATNGDQALEILRQGTCRLVISDWEMPGMSGLELCRQVRQAGFPHYLYMILLTSRDRREDIIEGLSAGADDFITKPYHPEELAVRVRAGQRVLGLETRDVMIFALAKLAESRDADTGAHLDRVRKYSRLLAEQLSRQAKFRDEVTPEYVQLIYLTSPLHDIGKVAIPDCVLLKPGVLNDREFEVMKSHARLGAETLEATLEEHPEACFLQMARDIAATHHERYDGSGYPAGLRGDDIPLCGRIVALADVYDALTSKRCYKDSFDHDVARSIILEGSGVHFDPDVVDAFLAAGEAFAAISGEAQPALSR
ncbi:MAG: response regulator [Pirellulales bacterium]